jgi:cation:H+ antiporter
MTDWLLLVGGGLLLYFGAEWCVGGASGLALSLRIPKLVIGLTVVAYGTSAPEVIVGIQAALTDHGDMALGNVIGSNIANIGLILGAATLVRPPRVDPSLGRRELPVLVLGSVALPLLLIDGRISGWEAAALLLAAVAYTAWMVRTGRRGPEFAETRADAQVTAEAADAAGGPAAKGPLRAAGVALVGLVVLLVGADLFVDGAASVARALGMSDRLVGLTIVSVGTSLPELVTSLIAAARGHSDIAVGNVIGSNIFNVFLCLGSAAAAGAVGGSLASLSVDLLVLLGMTIMVAAFIRRARTISRVEGGIAVACYLGFLAISVARG